MTWEKNYDLCIEYIEKNGKLPTVSSSIGKWLDFQRKIITKGKEKENGNIVLIEENETFRLTKDEIDKLKSNNMIKSLLESKKQSKIRDLETIKYFFMKNKDRLLKSSKQIKREELREQLENIQIERTNNIKTSEIDSKTLKDIMKKYYSLSGIKNPTVSFSNPNESSFAEVRGKYVNRLTITSENLYEIIESYLNEKGYSLEYLEPIYRTIGYNLIKNQEEEALDSLKVVSKSL